MRCVRKTHAFAGLNFKANPTYPTARICFGFVEALPILELALAPPQSHRQAFAANAARIDHCPVRVSTLPQSTPARRAIPRSAARRVAPATESVRHRRNDPAASAIPRKASLALRRGLSLAPCLVPVTMPFVDQGRIKRSRCQFAIRANPLCAYANTPIPSEQVERPERM